MWKAEGQPICYFGIIENERGRKHDWKSKRIFNDNVNKRVICKLFFKWIQLIRVCLKCSLTNVGNTTHSKYGLAFCSKSFSFSASFMAYYGIYKEPSGAMLYYCEHCIAIVWALEPQDTQDLIANLGDQRTWPTF